MKTLFWKILLALLAFAGIHQAVAQQLTFTASPTSGLAPLTVQFYGPTTNIYGDPTSNLEWNFGDGTAAVYLLTNPTHVYTNVGTFNPTLLVGNSEIAIGPSITVTSLDLSVDWFKVAGGGGTSASTDGVYCVSGTFGQPDAGGPMQGGGYLVEGGFWSPLDAQAYIVSGLAPTITRQPQSVIVTNGAPASFSVTASGTPPLFYQWQKNGINLTDGGNIYGSTITNLTLSTTSTNDTGSYTIIIENAYGSVTSSVAKLTLFLAAYYDAAANFSITKGNPNGSWSYGVLSSFTGGTFTLFSQARLDYGFPGELRWDNNTSPPYSAQVFANPTGSLAGFGTVVVPTNQLDLDGQSYIADVRWTAPANFHFGAPPTISYNVIGLFQRNDNNPQPVSVRIVENGATTLFAADNFTTYGSQQPFNLINLILPAGTVLDFAEGAPQYYDDTTGLQLSISAASQPVIQPSVSTFFYGGFLVFTWNSVYTYPPVGYQVQYTTNLSSANWISLGGVLAGPGPTFSATGTNATDAQRFYRVLLVQ
jgi:PKD repeat protein